MGWFMNRFLPFFLMVLPCWSVGGSGAARAQEDLPALIQKIQPAVVTVMGFDAKDKVIRLGSGFFVSDRGHLITSRHNLQGIFRAEVKLPRGERYPLTTVVAEDDKADLLKLSVPVPGGTPFLPVADLRPQVGEHVLVVGNPLGLEQSVSEGLVSALRTIPGRGEVVQISAPISPGSSGGPVVNRRGQVIGVVAFQVKGQQINFAVPAAKILALRDGPGRPLIGPPEGKKSLPPKPSIQVPKPQMRIP
jgi:S1-C subfamily serine protease